MRRRLGRESLQDAVIDEAISVLADQGYLDDDRFARLFVQDKRELEEWGRDRIRRGLLGRGIEREVIDEALGEGDESDLNRALALLNRRFPTPPRERRERDRALGGLIRKGYDPGLALDALTAMRAVGDSYAWTSDRAGSRSLIAQEPARYYDPPSERMAPGPRNTSK